jgi:hypothetical protein
MVHIIMILARSCPDTDTELLVLMLQDTYGPPLGKRLLLFLDDLNMPRLDTYGTQQPLALLKLFIERKGLYDRSKELNWKNIKDVQVGAIGREGLPGLAGFDMCSRAHTLVPVQDSWTEADLRIKLSLRRAGTSTAQHP